MWIPKYEQLQKNDTVSFFCSCRHFDCYKCQLNKEQQPTIRTEADNHCCLHFRCHLLLLWYLHHMHLFHHCCLHIRHPVSFTVFLFSFPLHFSICNVLLPIPNLIHLVSLPMSFQCTSGSVSLPFHSVSLLHRHIAFSVDFHPKRNVHLYQKSHNLRLRFAHFTFHFPFANTIGFVRCIPFLQQRNPLCFIGSMVRLFALRMENKTIRKPS